MGKLQLDSLTNKMIVFNYKHYLFAQWSSIWNGGCGRALGAIGALVLLLVLLLGLQLYLFKYLW